MKTRTKLSLALLLSMALGFSLAGCALSNITVIDASSASAAFSASGKAADSLMVISFADNYDAEMAVANDTEQKIVGVELRISGTAEFSDNLLEETAVWMPGDKLLLRYDSKNGFVLPGGNALADSGLGSSATGGSDGDIAGGSDGDTASTTGGSAEAKSPLADAEIRTLYDINLRFYNGVERVIHNFAPDALTAISLRIDDTLAFLVYNEDGNSVSTLDSEKAISDGEAAAAAAAQAALDAEAAAAAAEAEAVAVQDNGYGYDYDYSNGGGSSGGAAPTQSADNCLGDVALN